MKSFTLSTELVERTVDTTSISYLNMGEISLDKLLELLEESLPTSNNAVIKMSIGPLNITITSEGESYNE